DYFIVLHLMIAGRLRWQPRSAAIPRRYGLAAFDFPNATLLLTEASKQQRASIHLARGARALAALDRGGLEVLEADLSAFQETLARERHTLKRALTDPRLFSGIGNAYSDEILHAARLSPLQLTSTLTNEEVARLHQATRATLRAWIERPRSRGQVLEQVACEQRIEMQPRALLLADAMAPVRILHEVHRLAERDQPVEQALRALVVHVVVSRAVHHEQPAAQPFGVGDGRG